MRITKFSAAAALYISALLLLMSGCYFFPEEEPILSPPTIKAADVTYSTYTARKGDIVQTANITGYIYSGSQADLAFTEFSGQLKTVYPAVGDYVNEGDLIAELDTDALSFELRTQELKVELAQLNVNQEDSAANRLQLEIERNTLSEYQARYAGSRIFAPMSGRVCFVDSANPGDVINPYRVMARIADPEQLCVKAAAQDTFSFKTGDVVTLRVANLEYPGVVISTPEDAPEGSENAKRVVAGFSDIKNKPDVAVWGKLADIVLIKAQSLDTVIIPKNLVHTADGTDFVQILENGEKRDVPVTMGISNATEAEILSGVNAGDSIVVK